MRYIITIFLVILFSVNAYGYEEDIEKLPDIGRIESSVRENTDLSFKELIKTVLSGEDIIHIIKGDIKGFIKKQFSENSGIKSIIAAGIICGIINMLSQDINDRSTSELIGLTGRIMILAIAAVSLKNSINILQSCIIGITDIINSSLPFVAAVASARGQISGGGLILAMGTDMTAEGIKTLVIPLLVMGTSLKAVNIISGREILDKLSELFICSVTWSLKIFAYGFVFFTGLERISGGIVSRGAGSILKSAVKMIPVVGDIVGGAGEIAMTAVLTIGNAAGIVLIVVIIVLSSLPLIEIAVTASMYKLAAAVLEPVCDKTTIAVIDTIGEANFKVMAALFTVDVMFIMSLALLLCSVR